MAWPKQTEKVVLTVNGRDYSDWETVSVKHELGARPPYLCRFTCSEGLPLAQNFAVLQIKPGMECTVTLAGHPAFKGEVMTRQVYYDANRHHIEIMAGTFAELSTSSVITQTGEWRNKTFQQIAQDVLNKFGYNLTFEGGSPPSTKFDRVSTFPGETPQDFLDALARSLGQQTGRAIKFTADEQGNYVAVMGPNEDQSTVKEGENILIGREIIYNQAAGGSTPAMSQAPGTNKKWGADVAHVPFVQESVEVLGGKFIPGVIVSEIPTADKQMLQGRATSENSLLKGDEVTVTVTVYGWIRPQGGLWRRNQKVAVYSPMLVMYGDVLEARSVTFTQDNNSGTRTTLVLCNELAMNSSGGGVT